MIPLSSIFVVLVIQGFAMVPDLPPNQVLGLQTTLNLASSNKGLKLGDLFSPSLKKLVVLCPYEEKPTFFEKKNRIPPGLWPGQDEASQTLIFIDGSGRDIPLRVSRGLVDFCVHGSVILRSDAAISIHSSELGFKEIIYESSST
ncbi:MAG: hypothetical protein ORN27_10105 [Rhodoluna sp.]|nr:hypothetical protein [Rhodoluna sp.]